MHLSKRVESILYVIANGTILWNLSNSCMELSSKMGFDLKKKILTFCRRTHIQIIYLLNLQCHLGNALQMLIIGQDYLFVLTFPECCI